jgi:LuxR family maltose regulon positive regulatory protein
MYAVTGDQQKMLATTAKALELAEPESFISTFVEEGKPVADILTALLAGSLPGKVRPAYVQQILAAYPHSTGLPEKTAQIPQDTSHSAGVPPLVEPLTARELEVLHLIAYGDSNQAIAEKLVITVSAVKKHAGNIYGKLNVSSRTQAISRARQLRLLSPGG